MARTPASVVALTVTLAFAASMLPGGAQGDLAPFPDALNVVPTDPKVGSCIPFANNVDFGFSGFIYRQVPPFKVSAGTPIAFDLGATNDVDVRRDIYFSAASHDPGPGNGNVRAVQWVKVVSETQLPLSPRGNTVVGDYELRYRAEAPFAFGGGGFIIGFGASPPGFHPDPGCEQVGVHTSSSDPSGNFFGRFWGRPDRDTTILDRGTFGNTFLSGFVIFADVTPPAVTATISPEPGADGWIAPGDANVTFTGTDDGSGVASCDEPVMITDPGVHEVTGGCVDNAGNVGTATVTVMLTRGVVVDVMHGNPQDVMNDRRRGLATFTVMSRDGFDAHGVDLATMRFGVTGTEQSVVTCGVSGADLRCRFDVARSGVAETLRLVGYAGGVRIAGETAVRLVR